MKKAFAVMVIILAAASAAAAPGGDHLIRLAKEDAARIPALLRTQLQGLQELQACWVVRVGDGLAQALTGLGFSFEVLDSNPEGKAYFLVRTASPADAAALAGLGEVRPLDGSTALFWAGATEAREVLPETFAVKRLHLGRRLQVRGRESSVPIPLPAGRMRNERAYADDVIPDLVAQVSKSKLGLNIQDLQDFQTRYASTTNCESAGTYLFDYFQSQGLAVEYQSFAFGGKPYTTRNIVATLPGHSSPEQEVIVCAHYDSTSNQPLTLAPGADDNASGTSAVMETARILAGRSFDFTVRFICFSAEEWGLYGSEDYASKAAAAGVDIVGVLNLDMIAYAPTLPETLDLYVNSTSGWLADRFRTAADRYAPLPVQKIVDASATWSDHSPFWDQGYSALCGIEDSDNPYYHKTTDTFSTLNMDFTTSITRAVVAAAADLAQPTYSVPTPTGLRAQSQVSSSLFDSIKTAYLDWDAVSKPVAGYNVYRTTTSHAGYQKLNSSPLADPSYVDRGLDPGTTYYYVVTAVDGEGRESNFSQEVKDDENN